MVWRTDKPTGPAIVAKLTDDFCFGHGRYTILYLGTVDTLGVTTKCYLEDGEEIPDSAIEKWASLEEDKVSDDLEKAANNFSESDPPLYGSRYYWDSESLFGEQIETTFKAGANWQELKDIRYWDNQTATFDPKIKPSHDEMKAASSYAFDLDSYIEGEGPNIHDVVMGFYGGVKWQREQIMKDAVIIKNCLTALS